MMGSLGYERGIGSDEKPQHRVTVNSLLLGKYEVTILRMGNLL